VFEDVTELRHLAEQAQRADRLKQLGEMAAGVAHEIRNPLNGIEGFASLLVRDLPEGDKRRRYAELIVAGVRDLNATVTGLLEFTRPRRIERRQHDPAELALAVVELIRADATTGVSIRVVDLWRGGGTVAVDGAQLKQVLINLVRNAVQAARSVVEVRIEPGAEGGAVVFTVDDDGPGVPPEDRQRIFTPFFTTKDHGTGLGLALAHTIVSLHGGTMEVGDAAMGGARFRVVV
jgi:signal transduction histidine kinase